MKLYKAGEECVVGEGKYVVFYVDLMAQVRMEIHDVNGDNQVLIKPLTKKEWVIEKLKEAKK